MSAESLARLALSPTGKLYAKACWMANRDPAAWLEGFDEVLAHDFRTALLLTREAPKADAEPDVPDGRVVTDLEAQIAAMIR